MPLFLGLSPLVGLALLAIGYLLSSSPGSRIKLTTYECGFSPIKGLTRQPFFVAFYLVAVVFLLFDLEITVIYPFASE